MEKKKKEKKYKPASKKDFTQTTIGKLLLWTMAIFVAGMILRVTIMDYLIRTQGICTKVELSADIVRARYHQSELAFYFHHRGKIYKGNSLVKDLSRTGDSICIIYLDWMPRMFRPIAYFDKKTNCDCR